VEHKTHQPSEGYTATKHILVQLGLNHDHESFSQFGFFLDLGPIRYWKLHYVKQLLDPYRWMMLKADKNG
jgi:hypothetical protein